MRESLEEAMGGSQLEKVMDLIDENLLMNRNEVLRYIQDHSETVAESIRNYGEIEIPTSAGPITVKSPIKQ